MTFERWHVNRRNVLSVTAASLAVGLAGCLGDGDDADGTEDDGLNDGETDDEPDEDGGPPDVSDWSDEEIRAEFVDPVLDHLNDHSVEAFNELRHRDAPLDPLVDDGRPTGPRLESDHATLVEHGEDVLVIEAAVTIEGGQQATWPFEFRAEGEEWRLWDIDTEERIREPALSPAVVVGDFVDALNDGDSGQVAELLSEDGLYPDEFVENADVFEDSVELVETDVTDRERGFTAITVTVNITHDDGHDQATWRFEIRAIDGEWQITAVR